LIYLLQNKTEALEMAGRAFKTAINKYQQEIEVSNIDKIIQNEKRSF
jgi:hypothetical protein